MALDALEKERLRRKMAVQMGIFLESAKTVSCISGHYLEETGNCDLCGRNHARELLVIRNRSGKKMRVSLDCLKEMVRFQVCDVEELPRWLEKLKELKQDAEKRRQSALEAREEQRKKLEKRVIVRKRNNQPLV